MTIVTTRPPTKAASHTRRALVVVQFEIQPRGREAGWIVRVSYSYGFGGGGGGLGWLVAMFNPFVGSPPPLVNAGGLGGGVG
jgi:hypothetical protein